MGNEAIGVLSIDEAVQELPNKDLVFVVCADAWTVPTDVTPTTDPWTEIVCG